MNIVYLTFGDTLRYHVEANLSIRTFLRQTKADDRIVVFTDHPEYYQRARVETMLLTGKQMEEWCGPHQYKFRIKIMAVNHLFRQYPTDDLLFLDGDTFLFGNLDELKTRVSDGFSLMHLREGHPSQMKGRSLQMWKKVRGKRLGNIVINERHDLWNSGVIGVAAANAEQVMADWLALCDAMLDAGVKAFNVEEYALSISLAEHTRLQAANDHVGHYWGNKPDWEILINDLMCQAYMKNLTLEEEVAELDMDRLCQTPVHVGRSSRYAQMCRLADKLFPVREKTFVR